MPPPSQLPVRIHQQRKEPPIQPLPIAAPIPDQSEDHNIRPTPNRYYAPEEMALDPYLDVERIVFDPNVDTNSPFDNELDYVEEEYRAPTKTDLQQPIPLHDLITEGKLIYKKQPQQRVINALMKHLNHKLL